MKTLQFVLPDTTHAAISKMARERGIPVLDLVREGLDIGAAYHEYSKNGQKLFWEDTVGNKVELVIPGLKSPLRRAIAGQLTIDQADVVDSELNRIIGDEHSTKAELMAYLRSAMPCGHAAANLVYRDAMPYGCSICGVTE